MNVKHLQYLYKILNVNHLYKLIFFILFFNFFLSADCRVLSMEILPISKYNTSPTIIYGYAKTTSISVCI